MPAKRLSMRKIKDVLRLCWGQGLSKRKAARSCGDARHKRRRNPNANPAGHANDNTR